MTAVEVAPAEPRELLCVDPVRYGLLRLALAARDEAAARGERVRLHRCSLCGGYHLRGR